MTLLPLDEIVRSVPDAADPRNVGAARERLRDVTASDRNVDFRDMIDAHSGYSFPGSTEDAARSIAHSEAHGSNPAASSPTSQGANRHDSTPALKFESFILKAFIETMLPKEGAAYFGQGAGGGIWRSMMAEQLANQIARSGGVGIQKLVDVHIKDSSQHGAVR
jgi:hypothetical protein